LVVQPLSLTNYPAHIEIPVSLEGGGADLRLVVSILGLNKFTTTSGSGEGNWGCVATTPMAGANKTAVLACNLNGARPADPLALGLNIGYAGQGRVTAVLEVLAPAVDKTSTDNTASADLPTRDE
jgi:hypothetical protein